ncbi:MAG: hypothetical protein J6A56_05830, partial [Clostridia bacterium]|nr:hypothetical protein [Clostridia bacterium]
QNFFAISGTAAWLTALYTGILFLSVFGAVLYLLKRYKLQLPKGILAVGNLLLAIYWIFSAGYALREFVGFCRQWHSPVPRDGFWAACCCWGWQLRCFAAARRFTGCTP